MSEIKINDGTVQIVTRVLAEAFNRNPTEQEVETFINAMATVAAMDVLKKIKK